MLIIPAIDIFDGKCVRLCQGNFEQKKVYSSSPYEVAKEFKSNEFSFLHIVDLEGAKNKKITNWNSIEEILSINGLKIEVGGGIRTTEDIQRLLDMGVTRVVIGSIAVKSPDLVSAWIKQFGPEKIVVGIDVKDSFVAISGWLEESNLMPQDLISNLKNEGVSTFICTDISRDGMLEGVNLEFFKDLVTSFPDINFIASGGVSTIDDIMQLNKLEVQGVIVGKAIYEGKISLMELAKVRGSLC